MVSWSDADVDHGDAAGVDSNDLMIAKRQHIFKHRLAKMWRAVSAFKLRYSS